MFSIINISIILYQALSTEQYFNVFNLCSLYIISLSIRNKSNILKPNDKIEHTKNKWKDYTERMKEHRILLKTSGAVSF